LAGHTGQGNLEGEKPEAETPYTSLVCTAHTSRSTVLILDAAFPGRWLPDFFYQINHPQILK